MILLAHPFGNTYIRALLRGFEEANLLAKFVTTLGYSNQGPLRSLLPSQARRRSYDLPSGRIKAFPVREAIRQMAAATGAKKLTEHERGRASIDRVWQELDAKAAAYLRAHQQDERIDIAYATEDAALQLFETAQTLGVRRAYDLPIAYWETAQRILREEAERYPAWEPTLGGTRDSPAKLARKTRELELAELVICPSRFVLESLPAELAAAKTCVVAPFGSPEGGYDP